MPAAASNTEDPSTWLPLDGLEPGFDANRAPHTADLTGRELSVRSDSDPAAAADYQFHAETVRWHAGDTDGTDRYEAFRVDTDLYYTQFQHSSYDRRATSLVLDLASGRALSVTSTIGPSGSRPTVVGQHFDTGIIDGGPATGEPPHPSEDLLGRRMLWRYSEAHVYEHIYLTSQWYTFHCLAGPEQGLADTDACTYYRIRPGIYVFAWREKVVPCAAFTIADHRDFRSHGALFGLHEDGRNTVHFTFGAYGTLLSNTVYPGGLGVG